MTDIDKARQWADGTTKYPGAYSDDAIATAKIIQSLPDQWVDAENLERIIAGMDCCLTQGSETNFSDGFKEATTTWRDALKVLIPPNLPTLADMTQEEREACQWMQADVKLSGEGSVTCVIADPRNPGAKVRVWAPHGGSDDIEAERITPLPDLPKLQWPGDGVVDAEIVDEPETVDAPPAEKTALQKPEDVPDNELWLVECGGIQWFAKRNRSWSTEFAWRLISMVRESNIAMDSQITLIHKLVPESHTLPEGMRLADHEKFGRVVVAPRANTHGEESFYRTNEDISWGASHGYRPTGEFNFLDGDQHV